MDSTCVNLYLYYDNDRRIHRVDKFNLSTSIQEVKDYIRNELGIRQSYLETKDSRVGFVDFCGESLRNLFPSDLNSSHITTVNSTKLVGDLYIREISDNKPDDSQSLRKTTTQSLDLCSSVNSTDEHPEDEQIEVVPRKIMIKEQGALVFIRNINPLLRDEYMSNSKRTRTDKNPSNSTTTREDKKQGSPVNIQGSKIHLADEKKRNSVLPTIKISEEKISKKSQRQLFCYFLREVCKNGERTLYHHPIYALSVGGKSKPDNEKKINNMANGVSQIVEPTILRCDDEKYFGENGHTIRLKLTANVGTKTHSNTPTELFCILENKYSKATNYETNRLAIIPVIDGSLLWDELLLSSGVAFCHARGKINLDFEKILDENGTLMEKIPKINKNGPASLTTKETDEEIEEPQDPPPKRHKTGDKPDNHSQLNSTIAVHETQPTSIKITNILSSTSPSNTQDNSLPTVYTTSNQEDVPSDRTCNSSVVDDALLGDIEHMTDEEFFKKYLPNNLE